MSFGSSSPTESESNTGSSWGDSDSPEQYHSGSHDVVFLGQHDEDPEDAEGEENGSDEEDTFLLDITNSDSEEVRKAAAHDKAHQSDVLYAAWRDRQTCQGNDDIAQRDRKVCDHADIGKRCEAPDEIGPPLTYMEEHGVFKPAEAISNPMGLCRFYQMSPKKSNVLTGPKSADCAHRIQGMVEIAKRVRQHFTIVIFEGESVSPICLLQELYSCLTLSRIMIHTPDEAKVGVMNCIYCCPIYMYMVKNNLVFLNHIVVGHYWGSFSCGKCLSFVAATAWEMKRHIAGCGKPQMECSKAHSVCSKVHHGSKSSHRSRKAKKRTKEGVGVVAWKRPRSSPTKSIPVVTSQEQVKEH